MIEKEQETSQPIDTKRRCFLRRATALVGGAGLVAASTPFLSYWLPSADTEAAGAPIKVEISQLKPGEQLAIPWRNMPIWVIYRTQAMLDTLSAFEETVLRDPTSLMDQQPAYCKNSYRAIKPSFFVSIGICTHLGCVPTYRPDKGGITVDWPGGFYCPCHGSKYDLAGRVYQGVPAPLNLKIPRHTYLNDSTLLIGQDQEGVEGAISIS